MNSSLYPRRSKRLRTKPDRRHAAEVFQVAELLYEILCLSSWGTLVSLSKVNIYFRDWVYRLIRHRITNILTPFIENIDDLFNFLEETKSVIIGSAVWAIMSNDGVKPRDLNLAVPQSTMYSFDRMKSYLCDEGTFVIYDGSPKEVFKTGVERFLVLKNKHVRGFKFIILVHKLICCL